jgi:hypothetical protein
MRTGGARGLRVIQGGPQAPPVREEEPAAAGPTGVRRFLLDGVAATLGASAAHWVAYHVVVTVTEGDPLEPSRYMASVLLGRAAFDPDLVHAGAALGLGWLGHLVVCVPWAFAVVGLSRVRPTWFVPPVVVVTGLLAGLVVWASSVYLVSPALGMTWMPEQAVGTLILIHLIFGLGIAIVRWPR